MCFYYAITQKRPDALIAGKIIKEGQLGLIEEKYI